MSDIPVAIPEGFSPYSRSPDFTPETLPEKLRSAHSTKAGTWGLLHVLEGQIVYRLEAPKKGEVFVSSGHHVVIEEGVNHSVAFVEPGRFYIEFFRKSDAKA